MFARQLKCVIRKTALLTGVLQFLRHRDRRKLRLIVDLFYYLISSQM